MTSQNNGNPRSTPRPGTIKSRRRMTAGGTGTCVSRNIRSMLRSGMAPPASTKTWRHAAMRPLWRPCARPERLQASLWWPWASTRWLQPRPLHTGASARTARPSRRRNAHNISELVRRSCSVEGHVEGQAPAYGPEQERKRARPGRGPAAEVAVSVRSIDSYSRCSHTLLAECCQPCCHSPGTLSGVSALGGGAPSHSACHEGRACIPRPSRVCPAHAAAKMPCGMPCATGP